MKKNVRLFSLLFMILTFNVFAQTTGLVENFDDGNITKWTSDQSTYKLSAEDKTLKIEYNRDGSSAAAWYNFNYANSQLIDVTNNPVILIRLKSTVNTTLSIKPTSTADVPLIMSSVIGDGAWRTIKFNVGAAGSKKFDKIYMYFDGGTTMKSSGTVWFDEIRMGDSTVGAFPADWTAFDRTLSAAQNLLLNSTEGSGEGNFPAGSKATLQSVVNSMVTLRAQNSKDQKVVDKANWDLADACVKFEISAITAASNLVDKNATKQTKYLYMNMIQLQQRSLIFGMHDATGYGVGWSGDDVRSDVKDVCGDYPALFSEDVSTIELDRNVDRMRNRLTAAYHGGSVITMCWHQYDPDGVGFYFADAKGVRVVANILPGGSRNAEYKAKLNKVATFFKTLRGSKGESIPVIFRPYHEHSGNAFWWGPGLTTTSEYNQIWQYTQSYLRDSLNVHNLIYALSPMLYDVDNGDEYFKVYPGDNYIDIFGADYYFSKDNPNVDPSQMMNGLRTISTQAKKRNKISALTEVGQENLAQSDWFTKVLLNPIKADTVANNIIYAAVWRNESVNHHFAPYPGDATVPDFIKFYNDPFTVFQKDLPNMYVMPAEDKAAPKFVSKHDATLISTTKLATITVETDERAFLRYSFADETYDKMKNQFTVGEGSFKHSVQIEGVQGEVKTIYVQAQDIFGNKTVSSLAVKFKVDTLQTPIAWTDKRYPTTTWKKGAAILGTDASAVTKVSSVQTIYYKNNFNYNTADSSLLITANYKGGVVIYLNGTEIGRFYLPTGSIEYNTAPTSTNVSTSSVTISKKVNASLLSLLQKDVNSIAFEIHGSPTELSHTFRAQAITQFRSLVPYSSEWFYFDNGSKPADVKLGDITAIAYNGNEIPANFNLYQNYPNPFNPTTRIKYDLASQSHVSVQVFDILGQKVSELINEVQQPGVYDVKFDGSNLSSGVYLLVLQAGDPSSGSGQSFVKTQKMILMK
ncbi:MAG: glycosyl hydrolase [Melioribacteraceae bacterium]